MNESIESRARHWEKVMLKSSGFPPDLIPQIAYILGQDDIEGLDSRTPAQIAFLGSAIDARQNFTPAKS